MLLLLLQLLPVDTAGAGLVQRQAAAVQGLFSCFDDFCFLLQQNINFCLMAIPYLFSFPPLKEWLKRTRRYPQKTLYPTFRRARSSYHFLRRLAVALANFILKG